LKQTIAKNDSNLAESSDAVTRIEKRSQSFIKAAVTDADNLHRKNEAKARMATLISTALYVFGWSLGLAGQLFGTGSELAE
jgi:hypothetical protein